jgi:hypothetical protein
VRAVRGAGCGQHSTGGVGHWVGTGGVRFGAVRAVRRVWWCAVLCVCVCVCVYEREKRASGWVAGGFCKASPQFRFCFRFAGSPFLQSTTRSTHTAAAHTHTRPTHSCHSSSPCSNSRHTRNRHNTQQCIPTGTTVTLASHARPHAPPRFPRCTHRHSAPRVHTPHK